MMDRAYAIPRATYRLQLNKDFTFADAAQLAPYLQKLGISHAYLSPILKARPGSTHGYDIVDHEVINPELGTIEDFRELARILQEHEIGIILDIVPNHMGIGGADNAPWLDMLEWGQASRYAHWFDINWTPSEPSLAGKVLVPFLGVSYDEALSSGQLQLRLDKRAGALAIWAHDSHKLPLAPWTYGKVLRPLGGQFAQVAELFDKIDPATSGRYEHAQKARIELSALADNEGLARHIADFTVDQVDELIDGQNWRVARFSTAADDINYRRFFIVSDLAGIRIENEDVFDKAHELVFQLIAEGLVDGLRVDHIDGLYDPKAYCLALREKCPRPIYLVVEKILAPFEQLRPDWQVDGTTGYEFATKVNALLCDPKGEAALTSAYQAFTGNEQNFDALEQAAKLEILDRAMAAELDALTVRACLLAQKARHTRDLTRNGLRNGLRQIIAEMPVYRTYIDANGLAGADRRNVCYGLARARRNAPWLDGAIFDFLEKIMLDEVEGAQAHELTRRIQQLTGPVMAKGLEDTALYRYNRLVALNDVGQRPDRFSLGIQAFHAFNAHRVKAVPHGMLTTSSHDTKRGEDTRARLLVLSGMAEQWAQKAGQWANTLPAGKIDPDDLWLFFQLLLGAWPVQFPASGPLDQAALAHFATRLQDGMIKSLREARLRTNWTSPAPVYEAEIKNLVDAALAANSPFLADFRAFAKIIARPGAETSLILTALKLTSPGVPDLYRGADLWEQSLVDPDNRRPVDFTRRRKLLEKERSDWADGSIKLDLTRRILQFRKAHPELFADGSYEPLEAGEPVLAFLRRHEDKTLLVAVRLYPWRERSGTGEIGLPGELAGKPWRNILNDQPVPDLSAKTLFADMPVGILAAG